MGHHLINDNIERELCQLIIIHVVEQSALFPYLFVLKNPGPVDCCCAVYVGLVALEELHFIVWIGIDKNGSIQGGIAKRAVAIGVFLDPLFLLLLIFIVLLA